MNVAHIKRWRGDADRAIGRAPAQPPYRSKGGIGLEYATPPYDGGKQFELHQTVNGNDVENAAWRFLCMPRAGTVQQARDSILPIEHDSPGA